MSNRLDQEREAELQPKRMQGCREKLESLGFVVRVHEPDLLEFEFKGNVIKLWPYSGWFSGKGVGSGRGFKNLLHKVTYNE